MRSQPWHQLISLWHVRGSSPSVQPCTHVLYFLSNIGTSLNQVSREIEWDKPTQGWVLSSFFYGYIVTQVIGGYLSGRFGGKRVMLTGMLVYGVSTLLIPAAARCVTVYLNVSVYLRVDLYISNFITVNHIKLLDTRRWEERLVSHVWWHVVMHYAHRRLLQVWW